jgi:Transcriptional regulator, AbiEi antitoxin
MAMNRDTRLALHQLAQAQKGLFSAAQAARLSIDYDALRRGVIGGYLRRARPGVYAISGGRPSRWEPMVAAALSVGPEAVISHSTAACTHRLWCAPPVPAVIELTVPRGSGVELSDVVVHRRRDLSALDVIDRHGVKVTSAARTLLDVAGALTLPVLERTLDEGLLARLWSADEIADCIARSPVNAAGRGRLVGLLEERADQPTADSVLESKAYLALRPLEPYEPHYVVTVGRSTYVLDAAWPAQRVAAEVVGRRYRVASRSTFDRERRKLNALAGAGWKVAHLTASMTPDQMVRAVSDLLGIPKDGWAS